MSQKKSINKTIKAIKGLINKKEFSKAVKKIRECLKMDTSDVQNQFLSASLGFCYFEIGDYKKAEKAFLQVKELSLETPKEVLTGLCDIYERTGEKSKLKETYVDCIKAFQKKKKKVLQFKKKLVKILDKGEISMKTEYLQDIFNSEKKPRKRISFGFELLKLMEQESEWKKKLLILQDLVLIIDGFEDISEEEKRKLFELKVTKLRIMLVAEHHNHIAPKVSERIQRELEKKKRDISKRVNAKIRKFKSKKKKVPKDLKIPSDEEIFPLAQREELGKEYSKDEYEKFVQSSEIFSEWNNALKDLMAFADLFPPEDLCEIYVSRKLDRLNHLDSERRKYHNEIIEDVLLIVEKHQTLKFICYLLTVHEVYEFSDPPHGLLTAEKIKYLKLLITSLYPEEPLSSVLVSEKLKLCVVKDVEEADSAAEKRFKILEEAISDLHKYGGTKYSKMYVSSYLAMNELCLSRKRVKMAFSYLEAGWAILSSRIEHQSGYLCFESLRLRYLEAMGVVTFKLSEFAKAKEYLTDPFVKSKEGMVFGKAIYFFSKLHLSEYMKNPTKEKKKFLKDKLFPKLTIIVGSKTPTTKLSFKCLLFVARIQMIFDDLENAAESLKLAQDYHNEDGTLQSLLGQLYYTMDQPKKAKKNFINSIKLDSTKNVENYRYMGLIFYQQFTSGDPKSLNKSLKCFQKALIMNPYDSESGSYVLRILEHCSSSQDVSSFEQVKRIIKLAIANAPNKTHRSLLWANRSLAYMYLSLKKYKKSQMYFQSTIRACSAFRDKDKSGESTREDREGPVKDEEEEEEVEGEGEETEMMDKEKEKQKDEDLSKLWEGLGISYLRQGKYLSSMKCFEKSSTLDPTNISSKYYVAYITSEMFQNFKVSNKIFSSLLKEQKTKEHESYAMISLSFARSHLLNARKMQKLRFFRSSYQSMMTGLGIVKNYMKDRKDHTAIFSKLMGDFHVLSFRCPPSVLPMEKKMNHLRTALECYEKCKEDTKRAKADKLYDLALTKFLLFLVLIHEKRAKKLFDESRKYIERAIETVPDSKRSSEYWKFLGCLYLRLEGEDNLHRAQFCFSKAIEICETNVGGWNLLGFTYLRQRDVSRTLEIFEISKNLDTSNSTNSVSFLGLGILYLKKKKFSESLQFLKLSMEMDQCTTAISFCSYISLISTMHSKSGEGWMDDMRKLSGDVEELRDYLDLMEKVRQSLSLGELNILGLCYESVGRYSDAMDTYLEILGCLKEDCVNNSKIQFFVRGNLARVYLILGKVGMASDILGVLGGCSDESLLNIGVSSSSLVYSNIKRCVLICNALCKILKGEKKSKNESLKVLLGSKSQMEEVISTVAVILYSKGLTEKATKYLEKEVKKHPSYTRLKVLLFVLVRKLGIEEKEEMVSGWVRNIKVIRELEYKYLFSTGKFRRCFEMLKDSLARVMERRNRPDTEVYAKSSKQLDFEQRKLSLEYPEMKLVKLMMLPIHSRPMLEFDVHRVLMKVGTLEGSMMDQLMMKARIYLVIGSVRNVYRENELGYVDEKLGYCDDYNKKAALTCKKILLLDPVHHDARRLLFFAEYLGGVLDLCEFEKFCNSSDEKDVYMEYILAKSYFECGRYEDFEAVISRNEGRDFVVLNALYLHMIKNVSPDKNSEFSKLKKDWKSGYYWEVLVQALLHTYFREPASKKMERSVLGSVHGMFNAAEKCMKARLNHISNLKEGGDYRWETYRICCYLSFFSYRLGNLQNCQKYLEMGMQEARNGDDRTLNFMKVISCSSESKVEESIVKMMRPAGFDPLFRSFLRVKKFYPKESPVKEHHLLNYNCCMECLELKKLKEAESFIREAIMGNTEEERYKKVMDEIRQMKRSKK